MTEPGANEIPSQEKDKEETKRSDSSGPDGQLSHGLNGLENGSPNVVPPSRSVQLDEAPAPDAGSNGVEETLLSTEAAAETERLSLEAEVDVTQRGEEPLSISRSASPEDSLPTASPRTASAGSANNETIADADVGDIPEETIENNKAYDQPKAFESDHQVDHEPPELERESTGKLLSEPQEKSFSDAGETNEPQETTKEIQEAHEQSKAFEQDQLVDQEPSDVERDSTPLSEQQEESDKEDIETKGPEEPGTENNKEYEQSEAFGQDQLVDQDHPELERDSTPLSEQPEEPVTDDKETTGPEEPGTDNTEEYKQSEALGQDQPVDQEPSDLERDQAPLSEQPKKSISEGKETTRPEDIKTETAWRWPSLEMEAEVSQRHLEEQEIPATAPPEDSMVYTATPRTVFEEESPSAGTHPLNMTWSFGINSDLPVFSLHDEDQTVILYICAHTAVLHDFRLNSQRHLQGHCSSISCVCVSEDRRWIATADKGPESLIIIWDSFSGVPVRTIFDSHPEGGVVAIAMSSDAKYLATVGGGVVQRVSIWKWTSSDEKAVCTVELSPNYGPQKYIIFNPRDHTQLTSNSSTQVIFYAWKGSSLEYSAPPLTDRTFKKVVGAFSQSVFYLDPTKALTGTSAGKLVVWDTISPPSITSNSSLRPHNKLALKLMPVQAEGITVLTVFDRYFVTGDVKGHVKFYDQQLELAHWYDHFNLAPIRSISFSKNPPIPASEKTKYPQYSTLKGQQFAISNCVISACNATVLHVSPDGTKLKKLLQEPCEAVHAITCHPSQPLLAIGSYSGILKVWDYKEKNHFVSRIFERGTSLNCLCYNPEGSLLGAGCTDGRVYILDSLTLEDECAEPFRYARGTITHISFSHDSQYLATADENCTVTVFKLICKGSDRIWDCLGRLRSHYKPIQSIIFGIHLDSDEARLLTLGMDRILVEYDLRNSSKGHLQVQSSDRIEQSATPKCLAWYPPVTKESFILTANDNFKMKLYNATTKMCRKTLLGPTYGSAVKKMEVLSRKDSHDTSKGYLAYITDDKVGLQILPVDGNPHKSSALICHPAGVSNFVSSCDGCYVFTAGGTDCTVLMWETNIHALEAAASLGGEDLIPFYGLLDGGRDGELFRELEDYFYYAQLRSQGIDTMEPRQVSTQIPLKEVPFIMRALGFYPSEQEIEDMLNEVKFSEYVNTGKQVADINLGEFIKLYTNHRPPFGISMNELQRAFQVLGIEDPNGEWQIDRGELLQLLQTRGEHLTEEELAEHLTTLLGINPEGGSSEISTYDSTGAAALLEQEIPQAITTRIFASEILGLPVYSSETGSFEEHPTDLIMTTETC